MRIPPTRPTFADLLLAFRQAKRAVVSERGATGRNNFAAFELQLTTRLRNLERRLRDRQWFNHVDIGEVVVVPKSQEPPPEAPQQIVEIGSAAQSPTNLRVRLQLEPSVDFAIVECLYLTEFGSALESILDDSCLGNRLKPLRPSHDRGHGPSPYLFAYWRSAFRRYRNEPIRAARDALREGHDVVVVTTDIVSYYDAIDPSFLLAPSFLARLSAATSTRGLKFSLRNYKAATTSLLNALETFRDRRRAFGGSVLADVRGVPIGSLTAKVFANLALAGLDKYLTGRTPVQVVPSICRRHRHRINFADNPSGASSQSRSPTSALPPIS